MADGLDLTRREFSISVAGLATLPSGTVEQIQQQGQPNEEYDFQGVAELEGPRDALPARESDFFDNKVFYAYRYIDEVSKASWYTTDDLNAWHPEPTGVADIEALDNHATSLVTRDGDLYVRRWA